MDFLLGLIELFPLGPASFCRFVTMHAFDRDKTDDGRTDGRTQRMTFAIPCVAIALGRGGLQFLRSPRPCIFQHVLDIFVRYVCLVKNNTLKITLVKLYCVKYHCIARVTN